MYLWVHLLCLRPFPFLRKQPIGLCLFTERTPKWKRLLKHLKRVLIRRHLPRAWKNQHLCVIQINIHFAWMWKWCLIHNGTCWLSCSKPKCSKCRRFIRTIPCWTNLPKIPIFSGDTYRIFTDFLNCIPCILILKISLNSDWTCITVIFIRK